MIKNTVNKQLSFYILLFFIIFSFQEILARLIFPMPEVLNFNRINYSDLWALNKVNGMPGRGTIMNATFLAQSELDGISFYHSTNLYGFRDKQWDIAKPNKSRLLFIGDSFVEGFLTSDDTTIPRIFEKLTNESSERWEVFNLGVLGVNIERYARLFHDAISVLKPNEIILILFANDFYEIPPLDSLILNYNTSANSSPFQPEYNNPWVPRVLQVISRLYNGYTVPLVRHGKPRQFFEPVPNPANPWTSKEAEYSKFIEKRIADAMKRGTFSPGHVDKINKIAKIFKSIDVDIKDYIIFMHNYSIINDVALSIVYIPAEVMVSDYYIPFRHALARNNKITSLISEEYQIQAPYMAKLTELLGIPFLNLTPYLKEQELQGNHIYWDYDGHMKPYGNAYSAESIYKWWHSNNIQNIRSKKTKSEKLKKIAFYVDGFDLWLTFTDNLGTGSKIYPVGNIYNKNGDLEVAMTKAKNLSDDKNPPSYPYVGIAVNFNQYTAIAIDLSDTENITLTYRLTGPMSLVLSQAGIPDGEEYRIELPPTDEYTEISIDWGDFHQPDWTLMPSTLDLTKLTGIKFQIATPDENHAILGIRSLVITQNNF